MFYTLQELDAIEDELAK